MLYTIFLKRKINFPILPWWLDVVYLCRIPSPPFTFAECKSKGRLDRIGKMVPVCPFTTTGRAAGAYDRRGCLLARQPLF